MRVLVGTIVVCCLSACGVLPYTELKYEPYPPRREKFDALAAHAVERLEVDRPELFAAERDAQVARATEGIAAQLRRGSFALMPSDFEQLAQQLIASAGDLDPAPKQKDVVNDVYLAVIGGLENGSSYSSASLVRSYLRGIELRHQQRQNGADSPSLPKVEVKVYLSGLEIWKNYDNSGRIMELYWSTITEPSSDASQNLKVRNHRAVVGSKVLSNFLVFRNEVVLNANGTDSVRVGLSVFDSDGVDDSEGQKLDNVVSELQSGLEGLDPTLGALKYVPLAPLVLDILNLFDPDDHVITAFLSLHASEYFIPNEESLRVAINDEELLSYLEETPTDGERKSKEGRPEYDYRVILYFAIEIGGVRLYHPLDRHWTVEDWEYEEAA